MHQAEITYKNSTTKVYFERHVSFLQKLVTTQQCVIITDENIIKQYAQEFSFTKKIIIPSGEQSKNFQTVDYVVQSLVAMQFDRHATIIAIGGGVVLDIVGFVAGIYKRGIRVVYVPTSLLAMVDAAIGGKNGVDIGSYKNMIGLIRQPETLFYNYNFLKTLPEVEWVNGFAEIIKHACICDVSLFEFLESHTLSDFQQDDELCSQLINRNFEIKRSIVQRDELEKSERKLLNFGHTIGHAIENIYGLKHGHAVSIGIIVACNISEKVFGFTETQRVKNILIKYGLTIDFNGDVKQIVNLMLSDKKRKLDMLDYVLLKEIGTAVVHPIEISNLQILVQNILK